MDTAGRLGCDAGSGAEPRHVTADPVLVGSLGGRTFAEYAGVGVERSVGAGYTGGAELGLAYFPAVKVERAGSGWPAPAAECVLISANAPRHFRAATSAEPFLTGGFSLMAGAGAAGPLLLNAGAGVDWTLHEHTALHVEARDHFIVSNNGAGSVLLHILVGIVIR